MLFQNRLQGTDDEFLMHYTFKCQNFRQSIRIAQYGLFFLIVNVKRDNPNNKTIITAWVQCVGYGSECKLFNFNLQMRIGNSIAQYADYVSIFSLFNIFESIFPKNKFLSIFLVIQNFRFTFVCRVVFLW